MLEDLGAKTLRYLYDFGDGWEHTVKIEQVGPSVPGILYPRFLDAIGRCPTSAALGATRSSWLPTTTPSTSAMPSSPNGWNPARSTLPTSTGARSTARFRSSPNGGHGSLLSSASLETNLRHSAEGYVTSPNIQSHIVGVASWRKANR